MAYDLTVDQIAHSLGGAKQADAESWHCRCPAHDDKKASLWIKQRPGGGLFVKCHAGCARENVEAALKGAKLWPVTGARKADNSAEKRRTREGEKVELIIAPIPPDAPEIDWSFFRRPPPTQLYPYRNAEGDALYYIARWSSTTGEKEIRPVCLTKLHSGRAEWRLVAPPTPRTLYNLDQLREHEQRCVLVVEGEKAADAATRSFPGHTAVTWSGGANAIDKTDFSPLKGRKIVLWPDADDPGRAAMMRLAEQLTELGAASVLIVDIPRDFPKGWDVADSLPIGWTLEDLLARSAPPEVDKSNLSTIETGRPLIEFVLTAPELAALEIEPREYIVEPFIATQSMNMMYAKRGIGKTFTAMTLALSVARGEDFFGFSVSKERRVLYIDGEMPTADLQRRLLALCPSPPENLMIVPSEILFRNDRPINLQGDEDRIRVNDLLKTLEQQDMRPELIILDNLSSLTGGVDENDNSALDQFLQFLVGIRHAGYAILMIHHAGKSGSQRGASRREDLLDTSIELKDPPKKDEDGEDLPTYPGAHFILWFPKTRDRRPEPEEIELKLMEDRGQLVWTVDELRVVDGGIALLRTIWETKPETQKQLADYKGLTSGRISQVCKKLRQRGLLENGQPLRPTDDGKEAVIEAYPEIEPKMLQQGELGFRDVL